MPNSLFSNTAHPSMDCDYAEFKQRTSDLLMLMETARADEAKAGMRLFAASYMGLHADITRAQRYQATELVASVNRAFAARLQQLELVVA